MRECNICHCLKDESQFNKHSRRKDGLRLECVECGKAYAKEYYRKTKESRRTTRIASVVKTNKRRAELIRQEVLDYLSQHPCTSCGETDVLVLCFHHPNPHEKKFSIGNASSRKYVTLEALRAEMDKCDVLCSNCHVRLHAPQYKLEYVKG